jgi:hypothetical protein
VRYFPAVFVFLVQQLSLNGNTSTPNGPHSIIQDSDRGLEPPMQSTEKHPQPFQRVRQHQPGQVFLCEWATNPNTQPFLAPFKIWLWYRPVSTSPDDRFNDLILRSSGELEECLEVDGGPVFTED